MPYNDLFLYDVKSMDSAVHEKFTGVRNERILDNLSKLLTAGARVRIRVPVIPSVNDSKENILALKDWLLRHGIPEKIELLPYHRMGVRKAMALGKGSMFFDVSSPEKMRSLKNMLVEIITRQS